MSTQHTPGPWRYWACKVDSRENPPMYDYAQFANLEEHVFRIPLKYLRNEDARLIAAAPDLLEALKKAVERQAYRAGEGPDWWEKARAAIAKATGAA